MQAIPQDVNSDDVWQWLNRGWFWYEADTGLVPAQLQQIERHEYCCITLEGDEYAFERDRVFPHWPTCGAVNLQGFAIIIDRQQSRQYRRTYNSRCVLLDVPRKWEVMKRHRFVRDLTPDSAEVVKSLFTPEYYGYERAMELLDGGWVSVALNPYLIVAGTRDDQLVYYRGKLIARVLQGEMQPLDDSNPRNIRILKYFDGRVRYADRRRSA